MKRKLFCEISPFTYKISVYKCRILRIINDLISSDKFSYERKDEKLAYRIYSSNSLIRRKLGNVDAQLQENKAQNLAIAAPKVTGIIIKPGEVFSFWKLVGNTTEKMGYKEGLTIAKGSPSKGIGGGLCQFTNLLNWMALHTSLTVYEYHHHDGFDLFPDYKRQIPFGTGTSIVYNYLDYRLKNNTDRTYQIIVYVDGEYLKGEIRADIPEKIKYHIKSENEFFSRENDAVYRNGEIYRITVDPVSGGIIEKNLLKKNHAKVMYDTDGLDIKIVNIKDT